MLCMLCTMQAQAQHSTLCLLPQVYLNLMLHSVYAVMRQGKLRLDAYLTSQLPHSSRGKLQAAIKAGNVVVNGKPELKTSLGVRPGDAIECVLLEPPVMQALPEVAAALS